VNRDPDAKLATLAGNGGPPSASADAAAWVREFAEGWRAPADAEAFADHFDRLLTDDIRLVQPQMPPVVGREAFRERFARPVFALIPDLHATVHSWAASGDVVFIDFTLEGTLGGKPISWPCVDRVTLRDGLAIERRANFDPTPLLRAVATRPRAWPSFVRLQISQMLKGRKS
jgi:ketosteroid isomerase-like protein